MRNYIIIIFSHAGRGHGCRSRILVYNLLQFVVGKRSNFELTRCFCYSPLFTRARENPDWAPKAFYPRQVKPWLSTKSFLPAPGKALIEHQKLFARARENPDWAPKVFYPRQVKPWLSTKSFLPAPGKALIEHQKLFARARENPDWASKALALWFAGYVHI